MTSLGSKAEMVLIDEDFNDDYTKSVGYFYDADRQTPHQSIASIFYSSASQSYMPWWVTRDTKESTDRFFASHSYYDEPGMSDDWLVFFPVYVPTKGFVLEFDAQSLPVRSLDNLSDLEVFITESEIEPRHLPEVPTFKIAQVPYGRDPDVCEGDWIHYSFSLDQFAGKEIHLNFANHNEDKDILCLDNVKVSRTDIMTIDMAPVEKYTLAESVPLSVTVAPIGNEPVADYTLRLLVNEEEQKTWTGDLNAAETFSYDLPVATGQKLYVRFELSCPGQTWVQTAETRIDRLAFEPVHRVMVEETTSLHCGNCPTGMYTIDKMLADPDFGDRFIPVSVHIAALGFDPMCADDYYTSLPVSNVAPLMFVDRNTEYTSFIPAYDIPYQPANPNSFAYGIAQRMARLTYLDVDVKGDWVIEGNDTTAIKCTSTITPALDVDNANLRVAFILTENNVGLDRNQYWIQENYLSGMDVDDPLEGWRDRGKFVANLRYHDVARAISEYDGNANSVPAKLVTGEKYSYEYTLTIPDTFRDRLSAAVQRQFCCLTAIVLDMTTGEVVNSARVAMSDVAENRNTHSDIAGIIGIDADGASVISTEWYDLSGRRVANPGAGVYLRRDVRSDGAVSTVKVMR